MLALIENVSAYLAKKYLQLGISKCGSVYFKLRIGTYFKGCTVLTVDISESKGEYAGLMEPITQAIRASQAPLKISDNNVENW